MRPDRSIKVSLSDLVAAEIPWVAEGSYGQWAGWLSAYASHFLFLNPPLEICLAHHASRPWEPHKYSSPQEQAARLPMLEQWVRQYPTREDDFGERAHQAAFNAATCPKAQVQSTLAAFAFLGIGAA